MKKEDLIYKQELENQKEEEAKRENQCLE